MAIRPAEEVKNGGLSQQYCRIPRPTPANDQHLELLRHRHPSSHMPPHDPRSSCPGTNCRRADLRLPLQPHVVLDGFYTIDAARHFDRLANVGPRTDEAA